MNDILQDKSFNFALRIVKLGQYLNDEKREFVLSKKILDSGTNIGLFIEEGKQGENRSDFRQKYSLANKEAFRTNFLLRLLYKSGYLADALANSLIEDCTELQKMLVSTLKTIGKID